MDTSGADGVPIPGASIFVLGTSNGTTSSRGAKSYLSLGSEILKRNK
jgi:hypothetical protein